ncbi:MAG TPA: type VI secretion system baseplate subunit TssG, partial [Duganella sp.]|uniref:type VI secretion system baseplate subunit TssG n=1 Tax=Duganella sp. TaxID=1904440 RepID=UPI002ED1467E
MRDPVALLRRLETEPAAFDFYAALRQLECAYPELPRIGLAARPRDEAVRFGQQPSLAFEPAMLAGLRRDGAEPGAADPAGSESPAPLPEMETAPRLLVNFFGLLGANGPLPTHLTEYIRDRQRNVNDPTLARFLDMFQHRMISLLYRAWSSAQPAVSLDRPGDDRYAAYVGALIGIGMPSLRGRDAVPDFAKLHYAGRLAPHARGAAGLEAILGDFFQVPVEVQQFVGHWMR